MQHVSHLFLLCLKIERVFSGCFYLYRHALHYLKTEISDPFDLVGIVCQKPQSPCSQIAEDLSADIILAQVFDESEREVCLNGVHSLILKTISLELVDQTDASSFLPHVQYDTSAFFVDLLHGDLGTSARYSRGVPITQIIAAKAPISIQMGLLSMAVSMLLGIPLGAAMARSKNKFWDKFGTVFIVLVNAVPAAVYYIYLQSYGSLALNVSMLFDESNWVSWILPVFYMSLGSIAYYAMWLRRYMLDEMNKDYVRLARAKGVDSRKITMRHVFRNAFVPMIQYIPTSLLYTVSGSIYIESLYSIPGMGGLLVDVISK